MTSLQNRRGKRRIQVPEDLTGKDFEKWTLGVKFKVTISVFLSFPDKLVQVEETSVGNQTRWRTMSLKKVLRAKHVPFLLIEVGILKKSDMHDK